MSSAKVVYFLRHGETEYNRIGVFSGITNVPINITGVSQSRSASLLLSSRGIKEIWCSPLLRARQTAEIVACHLNLNIMIINDLSERDCGEWEGKSKIGVNRSLTPPNGETEFCLQQRVKRVIKLIADAETTQPILLVSHAGVYREINKLISHNAIPESTIRAENGVPIQISIPMTMPHI